MKNQPNKKSTSSEILAKKPENKWTLHTQSKNLETNPKTYWGTSPLPNGVECLGVAKRDNSFTFDCHALYQMPQGNIAIGECGRFKNCPPAIFQNLTPA